MSRKVDLLNEPILPALTKLAVPIMATSLVQMAYNLTDMAWISQLGSGAVTAVAYADISRFVWYGASCVLCIPGTDRFIPQY